MGLEARKNLLRCPVYPLKPTIDEERETSSWKWEVNIFISLKVFVANLPSVKKILSLNRPEDSCRESKAFHHPPCVLDTSSKAIKKLASRWKPWSQQRTWFFALHVPCAVLFGPPIFEQRSARFWSNYHLRIANELIYAQASKINSVWTI